MPVAGKSPRRGTQQAAAPLHAHHGAPVFELAAAPAIGSTQDIDLGKLLMRRPVAAVALVPKSGVLFAAGAVAGALGDRPIPNCSLQVRPQMTLHQGHLVNRP